MNAVSCSSEGEAADCEEPRNICYFWSTWRQPQSPATAEQTSSPPPLLSVTPQLIHLTNPGKNAACFWRAEWAQRTFNSIGTVRVQQYPATWRQGRGDPASPSPARELLDQMGSWPGMLHSARWQGFLLQEKQLALGLKPKTWWKSVKWCLCLLVLLIRDW